MKQNKNTSVVVRVASVTLAAVFLICSLAIPSFAASENNASFIKYSGSDYDTSNPFHVGDASDGRHYYMMPQNSSADFYCFAYHSVGSTYYSIYLCPSVGGVQYSQLTSSLAPTSYSNADASRPIGPDSVPDGPLYGTGYGWYSSSSRLVSTVRSGVPIYSDLATAYSDLAAAINGGNLGTSSPLSTSIPAGNAIIINITGNNAEALQLSSSSALRHKTPWSDGNQSMMYTDSAPSSISTPYGNIISWSGVGSPNLFGGYNSWSLSGPLNPSKNYLVIVNPAYPNDNPDSITSNQASNGPISISCAYCRGYTIVPLSSYWNNGSISNESGGLRLDGDYDEDTGTWTTVNSSTGLPQNPVSGGMTDIDAEHVTINDWLQNISHQIGSFFSGAIGAVSNLVAAGSAFISELIALYSWLPAPVYSVLSSALILVITIGVIKVFV